MVAAMSAMPTPRPKSRSGPQQQTPTRRAGTEGENVAPHRRPKSREVSSRYLLGASGGSNSVTTASTPARRAPSPIRPRTPSAAVPMTPMVNSAAIKRSQSAQRRPAATPVASEAARSGSVSGSGSAAAKMLFTSTRSLSVSFQGESFSLKVSKAKPAPAPATILRRATPERRKLTPGRGGRADQVDNLKTIDQHRWPARLRPDNFMTRSLDCTDERKKMGGSGGSSVVRVLQKSMVVEANLTVVPGVPTYSVSSESVSSGSTSGGGGRQNIMIPARFWQENNASQLRNGRPSEHVAPMVMGTTPKGVPATNFFTPKRLSTDSPISSQKSVSGTRSFLSPQRGAGRPASPCKLATSYTAAPSRGMPSPARPASPCKLATSYTAAPSRGMSSPARLRAGVAGITTGSCSSTSSVLCFAADARRGRIGENKIDDAHFLRLLYNRLMQWRFVNARVDTASMVQILVAEKSLCNAWESTSELHDSVRDKRMLLWTLGRDLKMISILKGQMKHLDEWTTMDLDHSNALLGATEALKATTLRLPIIGGARADVQNIKDAIYSAVDVMQAMTSSVCPLLEKVDETNSIVADLANMVAKELGHVDDCSRLLSQLAVLQVKECSLRTHITQLSNISLLSASMTTETH